MMIVHPDFLDHWKTQFLVQTTGDKASPLLVLRLWAHCQQRRQATFQNMTPPILKAICRWEGDAAALFNALVEAGFIEENGNAITVHQWADVNATLLQSWENGKKGGRPPKTRQKPGNNPSPTDKNGEEQPRQDDPPAHEAGRGPGCEVPSLESVKRHAVVIGLHPDEAARFFDYFEQRGWNDRNGQPVRNWQAALRRWKVTAQGRAAGARVAFTVDRNPIPADYTNPNDPLLGQTEPQP